MWQGTWCATPPPTVWSGTVHSNTTSFCRFHYGGHTSCSADEGLPFIYFTWISPFPTSLAPLTELSEWSLPILSVVQWEPLWYLGSTVWNSSMCLIFLADYRPRHTASLHFYSGSLRILNRQFSLDHGRMESRGFWTETTKTQKMVGAWLHELQTVLVWGISTEVISVQNCQLLYGSSSSIFQSSLSCDFPWVIIGFPQQEKPRLLNFYISVCNKRHISSHR